MPTTEDEWKAVANSFAEKWGFPHCLGAIDGKHIVIRKPAGSGSYYYNYKKSFSIVLMALVNADCEFLMVDVGANGSVGWRSFYEQQIWSKAERTKVTYTYG